MKNIKSFKLFESVSDIISDINEIFLLEIKDIDDGYDIEVYDTSMLKDENPVFLDVIVVEISKWSSIVQNGPRNRTFGKRISFSIEEIEDGIHRILNYMTDKNYDNYITTKLRSMDDWTVLTMKEGDYTKFKLGSQEWRFNNIVSRIKIIFTKNENTEF
jgi:hypothetical protein